MFELLECRFVVFLERDERTRDRILAEVENLPLGFGQGFLGLQAAIESLGVDLRSGVEEAPPQSPFLDDLDVGVDPAEIGQIHLERGEVRNAAG